MMDPHVKQLWLKALRSGKYKQAHGVLRRGDRFCCLGVLCDLHAKATNNIWEKNYYEHSNKVLPSIVYKWAGLNYSIPPIAETDLAEINDGNSRLRKPEWKPQSFKVIADEIEAYL